MLVCNSVVTLCIAAWSVTWTQAFVENEIFRNRLDCTGGCIEYDESHRRPHPDFDTNLENQPGCPQAYNPQVDNHPVSLPDPDPRPEHQPELAEAPLQALILQKSTSEEPSSTLSTNDFSTETSTLSTPSDGSTEVEDEEVFKFEPFTESSADANSKNDRSYEKFLVITIIVGYVLTAVISLIILFTIIYHFCPVGKAQGKYSVELVELSQNNKETLPIYINKDVELEMTDVDLN